MGVQKSRQPPCRRCQRLAGPAGQIPPTRKKAGGRNMQQGPAFGSQGRGHSTARPAQGGLRFHQQAVCCEHGVPKQTAGVTAKVRANAARAGPSRPEAVFLSCACCNAQKICCAQVLSTRKACTRKTIRRNPKAMVAVTYANGSSCRNAVESHGPWDCLPLETCESGTGMPSQGRAHVLPAHFFDVN